MSWCALLVGLVLVAVSLAPLPVLEAQTPPTELRFAILTPRGSAWHRIFTAWGNTLRERTGGRLTIRVENAGPGDEASIVRRLRARELDGANLTAIGLGEIARSVLVLQAPGVAEGYDQLDRARAALDTELRARFTEGGVELLGWSDYGQGRVFSTRPIARPADFAGTHPWVLDGDPIFPEFLRVVGAQGVTVPIGSVMGALHDGRIDTVVASAAAVTALQWHTRLTHVTQQSNAVLLGGTVIDAQRLRALPPDLAEALRTTGAQAHGTLSTTIRRDDERFYAGLLSRGMQPVDASAHGDQWRAAARRARDALVGRLFTRQELDRAIAAAQGG